MNKSGSDEYSSTEVPGQEQNMMRNGELWKAANDDGK